MKIINIIITNNGVVSDIMSYPYADEQLVVEAAKTHFKELIKEDLASIQLVPDCEDMKIEDELEEYIENGYYETRRVDNTVYCFAESTVFDMKNRNNGL
jgi:hypothetical protein